MTADRTLYFACAALLFWGGMAEKANAWSVTKSTSDQPYTPADNDLLQRNVIAVETNNFVLYYEAGTAGALSMLTDGMTGSGNRDYAFNIAGGSITYTLDTTNYPAGFVLTGLDSYSGWQDGGRVDQNYVVSFRRVGSDTFGDAITNAYASNNKETLIHITDLNLANVAAIKFTFLAQENNGVGYKELDVFGQPATTNYTASGTSSASAFAVSSSDLLQNVQPALGEIFTYYYESGYTNALVPALTDGAFGSADRTTGTCALKSGILTYTLDVTNNPAGYTVTALDTFTGWSDLNRDDQVYWVSFRKVGSTAFGDSMSVAYTGTVKLTHVALTNLNVTDVEAVRFTFPTQENSGVGYKELDVFGAAPTYTEVPRSNSGSQVIASNDTANVLITEGTGTPGPLTLDSATTVIGTLTQGPTAGLATIDPAGQTLALGGLFQRYDAGGLAIGAGSANGTLAGTKPTLAVANWSTNELVIRAAITNLTGGPLLKTGTGTVTLYNTNACPGGTDVSAGTLRLAGNYASLGKGFVRFNGGSLLFEGGSIYPATSNSWQLAFANGAVTQTGGALTYGGYVQAWNETLALSGGTSYIVSDTLLGWGGTNTAVTIGGSHSADWRTVRLSSGTVTVNLQSGGRLYTDRIYSSVGAAGSVYFDGGTLGVSSQYPTLSSGDWLGVVAGSLSLLVRNGGAIIDTGNGGVTIKRPFLRDGTSTGGLTKTGSNTLTLMVTNANTFCTYAGDTVVQAGTLKLWPLTSPLPTGTRLTVASSAALDMNGATQTVGEVNGEGRIYNSSTTNAVLTVGGDNATTNFTGIFDGAVSLVKTGSGTLTLTGANTYSNATRILGGTLQLSPSPVTIVNSGFEAPAQSTDVQTAGFAYLTGDGMTSGWTMSGAGGVNIGSGVARSGMPTNAPWANTAPQGFQVAFLQGGSYMYQTVTVQRAGTYQLSFSAANRPRYSGDNVFVYIDNSLVASWTNSAFASNGVFANFATNFVLTTGAHELRFVGTVATPGGDTTTTFDNIRLVTAEASAFGTLPDGTFLEIASGATLDLNGTRQTFSGISGSGVITNGTAAVTGTIAPGGTNVVGTLTLPAASLSGTLLIDVATDGSSDLLRVSNALDLTGLTLQIQDLSKLKSGATYLIATCAPGKLTGPFAATNLGGKRAVSYNSATGRVLLINSGTIITIN